MADIRCPMCGKNNPAGTEVCKYCQARIKPLVVNPLDGDGGSGQPGKSSQPNNTPDHESSLPDWLRDLRQRDDEPAPDPTEKMPEWMQDEPQVPGFSSDGDAPDWLSRIRKQEDAPEESEAESDFSAPEKDDSQDFLAAEEKPGQDLPDWLSQLGSSEPESKPEAAWDQPDEEPAPAPAEEGDQPDWLQRIRSRQKEETPPDAFLFSSEDEEPSAQAAEATEAGETPDWLSSFQTPEPAPAEKADSLPDWLNQQAGPSPFSEPVNEGEEEVPDWLSPKAESGPFSQPVSESEEGVPDWLSKFGGQEAGAAAFAAPEETDETKPAFGEEENLPDWLTRLDSSATEGPRSGSVPALILDEEDLSETPEPDKSSIETPDLSSVPDWLSQVPADEAASGAAAGDSEAGLAPAELPSWLEAMRPVESAAPLVGSPEDTSGPAEKAGPLAGLRGVLPAEPEFVNLRKPQVYSIKLQVSEAQQAHIALLDSLLETEAAAKPVQGKPALMSQQLLRLGIAVVLILAVLTALFLNQQQLPLPANPPPEVQNVSTLINSLAENAPVLVAFDYEPGLSGELDATSSAVIQHLTARNAYLTLVSTSPNGPLLAERLITHILPQQGLTVTNYTNLGFISGGPTGLLALAENPKKVLPYSLNGVMVWEGLPLSGVQSVADFAMVMVITENPETARAWIEQVQPFLQEKNTPMVMVVSAQAEPMVRPYYETSPRQISGMVAGLPGAAAYEKVTGRTGITRHYWDAYGAGILVAVVIILAGSLINFVLAGFAHPKPAEAEGTL
ncbi:MAG: hypothetical protein EHM70_08510 [Chloroflexota bacterium]|nr:MAG: hypothetical protein EHM70_08510 [Chloroflexota bacterium]